MNIRKLITLTLGGLALQQAAVAQVTTPVQGVGTTISIIVEQLEFGPVLDVIPCMFRRTAIPVQMTIIPTVKEFLGYDEEAASIFRASGAIGGLRRWGHLSAVQPFPTFSLRQVVTSAIVWDGQTVVLGGLISEDVSRIKDKVPVLGDPSFAGRFFRSESSRTLKRNLMIFVTPTIIDPAGNRVHSE